MPTFQELQDRFTRASFKKAVLKHLVEYLDENFRTSAGNQPKKKLLSDQNIPVPEAVFEEISRELTQRESSLDEEIGSIMAAPMTQQGRVQ